VLQEAASNRCRSTSTVLQSSASRTSKSTSLAPRPPFVPGCASEQVMRKLFSVFGLKTAGALQRPLCQAVAVLRRRLLPVTGEAQRRPPRPDGLRRLEIFAKVPSSEVFRAPPRRCSSPSPRSPSTIRALEDELASAPRPARPGAAPTARGELMLGYARRMLSLSREACKRSISSKEVTGSSSSAVRRSRGVPASRADRPVQGEVSGHLDLPIDSAAAARSPRGSEDGRAEVGVVGARPGLRTLIARELMPDELVVVPPPSTPGRPQERDATTCGASLIVREQAPGAGKRWSTRSARPTPT